MITRELLQRALDEDTPQLLAEALGSLAWTYNYNASPLLDSTVFVEYEQQLLKRGLEEKPLAWWQVWEHMDNPTSWRSVLNKILLHGAVRSSSDERWLELWDRGKPEAHDTYQLAYQCVVHNNIPWLGRLCRHRTLKEHPHWLLRLLKDSMSKRALKAFVYLSDHLQNKNTPKTIGYLLKECVRTDFIAGLRHVINSNSAKILRQTYTTYSDFSQLQIVSNFIENETFVTLLTEGRLQQAVEKDVWMSVSRRHLNHMFSLYMSDIIVYRLSPPTTPKVEEVFFRHPYWNGLRMDTLAQMCQSAPSSHFLGSSAVMTKKWLDTLLPCTTSAEREKWLKSHPTAPTNAHLRVMFDHPLMQNALLRHEVKIPARLRQKAQTRKI